MAWSNNSQSWLIREVNRIAVIQCDIWKSAEGPATHGTYKGSISVVSSKTCWCKAATKWHSVYVLLFLCTHHSNNSLFKWWTSKLDVSVIKKIMILARLLPVWSALLSLVLCLCPNNPVTYICISLFNCTDAKIMNLSQHFIQLTQGSVGPTA